MARSTCTYSTTLLSPTSRAAVTLVAGKALGVRLSTMRRLEFVTVRDDIATAENIFISFSVNRFDLDFTYADSDRASRELPPHLACY